MKLIRIEITNFKSIQDLTIPFEENYHVLAGKNESGKTNILEAISYLNENKLLDKTCIREPLLDEEPITDSSIMFIFIPSENNKKSLHIYYKSLFINYDEIKDQVLLDYFETEKSIFQFFNERLECILNVDFISSARLKQYWGINKNYKVKDNWKKIVDGTSPTTKLKLKASGEEIEIGNAKIIDVNAYREIPNKIIENLTAEFINEKVGSGLIELLHTSVPKCIHWFYDSRNLLPSKVVLNEFKENPDGCLPLKYLFNLAEINNIKSEIDSANARGTKPLRNLLSRISKQATSFFNKKWGEYNDFQFELTINGANLEIGIKEENSYDFSQRSDGFKRFITFLIMISAQVETSQLEDSVLIIDEPEIGLHPSGQRFLRAELKKIAETNKVIFSTHSIFLIDTDNLENHYKVEKKNEITEVQKIESSNIVDEEVIYNALGYSVFETLKEKNILFEGWRDKHIFKIALSKIPNGHNTIAPLRNYGLTHAKGVKEIKYIAPILELANRECLILSDSDKPAKEKQKEFLSEPQKFEWKCYDDLTIEQTAITAEDFVKSDYIIKTLEKFKIKYGLKPISLDNLDHPKGKMYVINEWLKSSAKEDLKKDLNEFKEDLFKHLKNSNIENKYYELLEKIYQETN